MSIGDRNSIIARTRYRLSVFARRIQHFLQPTCQPSSFADIPLPTSASNPTDPRKFVETAYGSGTYGRWILDNDLPAYRYEMHQYVDDDAVYPVSHGAFRRDHWHQIGNDRINALASNDGTVQVYVADRGGMFLNRADEGRLVSSLGALWEVLKVLAGLPGRIVRSLFLPDRNEASILRSLLSVLPVPQAMLKPLKALGLPGVPRVDDRSCVFAGGFGYVYDGNDTWATAYRYHPLLRSNSERIFGLGYFKTAVKNRPIQVVRHVYAPTGNVPALLADVELTNTGEQEVDLNYYEYWDVSIEQLVFQAFRSGIFASIGDSERRTLNRKFTPSIAWDSSAHALRFHLHPPENCPAPPQDICWLPPDVFLADLSGKPDGKFVDKRAFFGKGGAENPDTIGKRDDEDIRDLDDIIMPYCMILRRQVRLKPGESAKLRFAYGVLEPDTTAGQAGPMPAGMPETWKQGFQQKFYWRDDAPGLLAETLDAWKNRLAYFAVGDQYAQLQREMAWHAYNLQASTVYSHYFDSRVVPQGSAYLYDHGLDGVPRDFALFSLPLTYLNPSLARDILCFIMQMTDGKSGQIAYSYKGDGALSDALVHKTPSDLDLFFLLALTEYIAATGDAAFLEHPVPFYSGSGPQEARPVLDHIRIAYHHLVKVVGVGENKLIRVLDGDWSDDVVLKNVFPSGALTSLKSWLTSPSKTVEKGESVLNSQMALYILPRVAKLLVSQQLPEARKLGNEMEEVVPSLVAQLAEGIRAQWQPQHGFYARAILRYWWGGRRILHADRLDLEGQVWALISDFEPEAGMLDTLKAAIYNKCDAPSPIGAVLASNQVWPAVSQMLTWGYTHRYPQDAWCSFVKHTFAAKAEIYGKRWINVWTGPDGVNGPCTADPGGTYETAPVTPMTDFPAMNNNQHAMALLALLRVCGIEPVETSRGLRIAPSVPEQYTLDLPLLKLDVAPRRICGLYRAHNDGTQTLYVRLPQSGAGVRTTINRVVVDVRPDDAGFTELVLPPFKAGDEIAFEVAISTSPTAP